MWKIRREYAKSKKDSDEKPFIPSQVKNKLFINLQDKNQNYFIHIWNQEKAKAPLCIWTATLNESSTFSLVGLIHILGFILIQTTLIQTTYQYKQQPQKISFICLFFHFFLQMNCLVSLIAHGQNLCVEPISYWTISYMQFC